LARIPGKLTSPIANRQQESLRRRGRASSK